MRSVSHSNNNTMSFTLMTLELVPETVLLIRYIFLLVHCSTLFHTVQQVSSLHCLLNVRHNILLYLPDKQIFFCLSAGVTVHQYKVILTYHLYPMMKDFYLDGSGVFQEDNATYTGHEVLTEWLNEYETDVNGLHSHQISTQLNIYGRFWTENTLPLHHHKITN